MTRRKTNFKEHCSQQGEAIFGGILRLFLRLESQRGLRRSEFASEGLR